MTKNQEKRFYKDMDDPEKQERYKKFVERQQTNYKTRKIVEQSASIPAKED